MKGTLSGNEFEKRKVGFHLSYGLLLGMAIGGQGDRI